MAITDLSWIDSILNHLEQPDERLKAIEHQARGMTRALKAVVALESQEQHELDRADQIESIGETRLAALCRARGMSLRRERCRLAHNGALLARSIVNEALGRQTIDDSTAGTGLDADERIVVMQVSGRGQ